MHDEIDDLTLELLNPLEYVLTMPEGGIKMRYTVGDRVMKDGYPGTVVRRYSEGMVEVRLARGLVCVPDEDLRPKGYDPTCPVCKDESGMCECFDQD